MQTIDEPAAGASNRARPGNPFLRYVGATALQGADEPSIPPTAAQENLPL